MLANVCDDEFYICSWENTSVVIINQIDENLKWDKHVQTSQQTKQHKYGWKMW